MTKKRTRAAYPFARLIVVDERHMSSEPGWRLYWRRPGERTATRAAAPPFKLLRQARQFGFLRWFEYAEREGSHTR